MQLSYDSAMMHVAAARKAKFLSAPMRLEWEKTFEKQCTLFKRTKTAVEAVWKQERDDLEPVIEAERVVEAFKKHRKGFDALMKMSR